MKELIRALVETYGPSGSEDAVRNVIKSHIAGHVDNMRVDALGNLIAFKKGQPVAGVASRKIMFTAHMDEIGVIVTHIDDKGFLRFTSVGGVFLPGLVGTRVQFADGSIGVIGRERAESPNDYPTLDKLFIDVGGGDKAHVERKVGDVAIFTRPFVDLGQRMMAKAFDDRIACAVLVQAILELKSTPHDVYFTFTVQEEVGLRGATTSAFGVDPDVAIAVDVTLTGDTPEAWPMDISLGAGPAIKVKDRGMLAHAGVKNWMIKTSEKLGVPYQLEVLEAGTTDAMAMQTTRAGIAAGVISVPSRYTHSPSEMVDYSDVQNSVRLLLGLLSGPVEI